MPALWQASGCSPLDISAFVILYIFLVVGEGSPMGIISAKNLGFVAIESYAAAHFSRRHVRIYLRDLYLLYVVVNVCIASAI